MFLRPQEFDQAAVQQAEDRLPPFFSYLDGELRGRTYLAGDAFGLADITTTSVLLNYLHTGGEIDAYPDLRAFLCRILARKTFRAGAGKRGRPSV